MSKSAAALPQKRARVVEPFAEGPDASLLDVLDHVLNKGVSAVGDVTLGVAGVDLIYLRLSALLCAADRVLPTPRRNPARSRHRQPGARKRR
jgi:hypothetical protein